MSSEEKEIEITLNMSDFFETKEKSIIPIHMKKTQKHTLEKTFTSPNISLHSCNFLSSIRVNPILGPYTVISETMFKLGKSDKNGVFDVSTMDDMYISIFQISSSKKSFQLFNRKNISGIFSARIEFEQKHIEKVISWLANSGLDPFDDVKYDSKSQCLVISVDIHYGNLLIKDGENIALRYL